MQKYAQPTSDGGRQIEVGTRTEVGNECRMRVAFASLVASLRDMGEHSAIVSALRCVDEKEADRIVAAFANDELTAGFALGLDSCDTGFSFLDLILLGNPEHEISKLERLTAGLQILTARQQPPKLG